MSKESPLFMIVQLPFNETESVKLNTPMIKIMDDTGNTSVALSNIKELGVLDKIYSKGTSSLEIGCGSGYLIENFYRNGEAPSVKVPIRRAANKHG